MEHIFANTDVLERPCRERVAITTNALANKVDALIALVSELQQNPDRDRQRQLSDDVLQQWREVNQIVSVAGPSIREWRKEVFTLNPGDRPPNKTNSEVAVASE